MSPTLFVAVATGQNVANLPPILELARPGDRVLWVESAQARRGGWSRGARAVLARNALVNVEPDVAVEEVNDPVEISGRLATRVDELALHPGFARIVLVLNGGQKLSPVGLLRGCERHAPEIVYGYDRPAVLWRMPGALDRPHAEQPFISHPLDLADVLECAGYRFFEEQPQRIWHPGGPVPALTCTPYGDDAGHTARSHQEHHAWAKAKRSDRAFFPAFSELAGDPRGRRLLERWKGSLRTLFTMGYAARGRADDLDSSWKALELRNLEGSYGGSSRLFEGAADWWGQRLRALEPPGEQIGGQFEQAVGKRLLAWLDRAPEAAVVQSCWLNVRICRESTPGKPHAEWDYALVLRNGIILSLECKSSQHTAEQKDLEARLQKLHEASSRLARMAVCVPLYSGLAGEPWFGPLHELRLRIEEQPDRFALIPFTLPGQPAGYKIRTAAGAEDFPCQTFEEALTGWVRPYLPRSSAR